MTDRWTSPTSGERDYLRVLAIASGSWGDILPMLPVAVSLAERGHEVRVAAPPVFRTYLRRMGVQPIAAGPFIKKTARASFEAGIGIDLNGHAPFADYWRDMLLADAAEMCADLADVAPHADVILSHYHSVAGFALAEIYGVPRVTLAVSPACIRSASIPPTGLLMARLYEQRALDFDQDVIQDGWEVELRWARESLDAATNRTLRALGVRPVDAAPFSLPLEADRTLVCGDTRLLPEPLDWPTTVEQVPYPYADHVPSPGADLLDAFLSVGRPPIVVSFGTAVHRGVGTLYDTVVGAARASGHRVVVLGHGADYADGDVLSLDFAPLSAITHRCLGVVHHGGPGTTQAVLQGGVPSLVIPQFLDQPLHAWLLARADAAVLLHPARASREAVLQGLDRVVHDRKVIDAARTLAETPAEPLDRRGTIVTHLEQVGSLDAVAGVGSSTIFQQAVKT